MAEDNVQELNESLNNKLEDDNDDGKTNSSSSELINFTDHRMALLTMRVDSAVAESESKCGLVEAIREVAMSSVTGEVIVVEEAPNSATVLLGPVTSPSTGSHVIQLVTLARQVVSAVRLDLITLI